MFIVRRSCREFGLELSAGQRDPAGLSRLEQYALAVSGLGQFDGGGLDVRPPDEGIVPITSVQFANPAAFGLNVPSRRTYEFRGMRFHWSAQAGRLIPLGGHPAAGTWRMLADAMPLLGLVSGFGSSAADTTKSRSATSSLYVNKVSGSEANTGLTPEQAKRVLPSAAPANTKIHVSTDSEVFEGEVAGSLMLIAQPGVVVTAYAPVTGAEVLNQPNPFARALRGGWVTQREKDELYFKLVGNGLGLGLYGGTGSRAFVGAHASPPLIRGAYIRGFGYAGIVGINGNGFRVEDSIIEDCQRTPGAVNSNFGGCGLRFEGATPSGQAEVVRTFISGAGEDAIWAAGGCLGMRLTDSAVRHYAEQALYSSQHADVVQMTGYPGDWLIRRCVLEHVIGRDSFIDNPAASMVGSLLIQTGAGSGSGGLMEDCIILSDNILLNLQGQGGCTLRRVLGVSDLHRRATQAAHFGSKVMFEPWTEEDCSWHYLNAPHGYQINAGGGTVTKQGKVSEFLG